MQYLLLIYHSEAEWEQLDSAQQQATSGIPSAPSTTL